jgi:hypothetical protein
MIIAQFDEPGIYSYVAIVESNCTLSSAGSFEVAIANSVNQKGNNNSISVLQLQDAVQLTFGSDISNQSIVKLFDLSGREVCSQRVNASKGQVFILDMNSFSTGIYNLQVIASNTQVFTSRVYKR